MARNTTPKQKGQPQQSRAAAKKAPAAAAAPAGPGKKTTAKADKTQAPTASVKKTKAPEAAPAKATKSKQPKKAAAPVPPAPKGFAKASKTAPSKATTKKAPVQEDDEDEYFSGQSDFLDDSDEEGEEFEYKGDEDEDLDGDEDGSVDLDENFEDEFAGEEEAEDEEEEDDEDAFADTHDAFEDTEDPFEDEDATATAAPSKKKGAAAATTAAAAGSSIAAQLKAQKKSSTKAAVSAPAPVAADDDDDEGWEVAGDDDDEEFEGDEEFEDEEGEFEEGDDNFDDDPLAASAPVKKPASTSTKDVIRFAIAGGKASPQHGPVKPVAMAQADPDEDPLAATFRVAPAANAGDLLRHADTFFTELKEKERTLNARAKKRMKEMKKANRQGGDSEGFKYVIPKSVKKMAVQMRKIEGLAPVSDTDVRLEHHYGAEGVEDNTTQDKPMRKKKRKTYDDVAFYQSQVREKWTKNAEKFLSRGKVGRAMFGGTVTGGTVQAGKKSAYVGGNHRMPQRKATKAL